MATPPPQPSAPPQPTRQQLDDLDALLQRMLALPVNPAEEPAPPSAEEPTFAEPLAPPAGNMILPDPVPAPPARTPQRPASPAGPVALPLLNPVPAAERRAPVLPPPDRRLSPRQALIASRPPEPPWLLRPLLALNRLFDAVAFALGPPGRWLRRPAGRTLLGLAGLMLLAAAAVLLVLDRIGWTW